MDRSHYKPNPELISPIPSPARSQYYRCVFCNRDFDNPQALGGHMNIHRKERRKPRITKNNPPSVVSVPERTVIYAHNYYSNPYYQAIGGCIRCFAEPHASSSAEVYEKPQDLSLFREEEMKGGEEEIDLELRLGQGP